MGYLDYPGLQRYHGKVQEEIDELKDDLEELIGGEEQQEITDWIYGSWINTGNAVEIGDTVDITNLTEWFSLKHVIVECQEGDKFILDITGATNARAYAFLTSANVLISRSDAGEAISGQIIAPQNAGKVIIQGIYRQTPEDTSDEGTAYKFVGGTGVVVRFDVVQDKTEAEKARARANIGASSGEGLSDDAKAALLACFRHVAFLDDDEDYYQNLYDALYASLTSLVATFTQGAVEIYPTTPLDDLRQYLEVVGYYNDGTTAIINDYSLSGTLTVGTSVITVSKDGITTNFNVTVTEKTYYTKWSTSPQDSTWGQIVVSKNISITESYGIGLPYNPPGADDDSSRAAIYTNNNYSSYKIEHPISAQSTLPSTPLYGIELPPRTTGFNATFGNSSGTCLYVFEFDETVNDYNHVPAYTQWYASSENITGLDATKRYLICGASKYNNTQTITITTTQAS